MTKTIQYAGFVLILHKWFFRASEEHLHIFAINIFCSAIHPKDIWNFAMLLYAEKKITCNDYGSLFDVERTSHISFLLNPSIHPWMGKPDLFNLSLPSMWKVFNGPHDSCTLRLMNLRFLFSTSSGSNIKRAFLTPSFAMLIPYLREINSVLCL